MFGCSTATVLRPDAQRRSAPEPREAPLPAGTISGLADSLATLLRRPLVIATLSGQLLACADPDEASGAPASSHRPSHTYWHTALRQLNSRRAVGSGIELGKTLRIFSEDSGESSATQIACPIRTNDVPVASVFIWEGPVRLSAICIRHAEHTALAAGLYLEQRQKCESLERGLGSLLLSDLLNGRFQADSTHTALAASINLSLTREYRVAMLNVHEGYATPRADPSSAVPWPEHLLAMLGETDAPRATCSSATGATFLLPAQIDVAAFWRDLGRPSMSLVVGAPAQGADAIASSYVDVQSLRCDAEAGQLYTHGKLLLPSVLRGDRGAQQAFVENIFGKLAKLRGGKCLIKSLAMFARVGFHQGRAAKALYIHPNTLRYRVERISQALGIDLLDADVRFRIQLASHLWALNVEQTAVATRDGATRRTG